MGMSWADERMDGRIELPKNTHMHKKDRRMREHATVGTMAHARTHAQTYRHDGIDLLG